MFILSKLWSYYVNSDNGMRDDNAFAVSNDYWCNSMVNRIFVYFSLKQVQVLAHNYRKKNTVQFVTQSFLFLCWSIANFIYPFYHVCDYNLWHLFYLQISIMARWLWSAVFCIIRVTALCNMIIFYVLWF